MPEATKQDETGLRGLGRDFVWGVSTAAYQIAGAGTEDGRGLRIWDVFCWQPGKIENGDTGEQRIQALRSHLTALTAAKEQGVKIPGYFVWSLMDNFEWAYGYWPRFGLVRVDYADLRRTPKKSFRWYAEIIRASRQE
jgi:beta-glucosidase